MMVIKMKILFISDIHGIPTNLEVVRKAYQEHGCNLLVVLGDLYYIGPRNTMMADYDILKVQNFLEEYSNNMICVQGNCDSEVDIEVSSFPIISGICQMEVDGRKFYFTHGHHYNQNNYPNIPEGGILIYGHEHCPYILKKDNRLFLNPGSISLPRNDIASYMIYEDNTFTIYDIKNQVIDSVSLGEGK